MKLITIVQSLECYSLCVLGHTQTSLGLCLEISLASAHGKIFGTKDPTQASHKNKGHTDVISAPKINLKDFRYQWLVNIKNKDL